MEKKAQDKEDITFGKNKNRPDSNGISGQNISFLLQCCAEFTLVQTICSGKIVGR